MVGDDASLGYVQPLQLQESAIVPVLSTQLDWFFHHVTFIQLLFSPSSPSDFDRVFQARGCTLSSPPPESLGSNHLPSIDINQHE